MSAMASQITSLTIVFTREGIGEFPEQRASNAENVWWRLHASSTHALFEIMCCWRELNFPDSFMWSKFDYCVRLWCQNIVVTKQINVWHCPQNIVAIRLLIHCRLLTPYDVIDLGQTIMCIYVDFIVNWTLRNKLYWIINKDPRTFHSCNIMHMEMLSA